MFLKSAQVIGIAALAGLSACGGPSGGLSAAPPAAEADYAAPPILASAARRGDVVLLIGRAPPGAKVRLAMPGGDASFAIADGDGQWSLPVPAAAQARVFGLSALARGRQVQAEGYVLIGPAGQTALLRAGSGAVRLDRPADRRIAALDFDRDGGAVLSGWAAPGSEVTVRLDGRAAGEGRADAAGRYSIAFNRFAAGPHRIEATGVGFTDLLDVAISPPEALAEGPLRSQLIPSGLRADWLTPGGGVQSTILAG